MRLHELVRRAVLYKGVMHVSALMAASAFYGAPAGFCMSCPRRFCTALRGARL